MSDGVPLLNIDFHDGKITDAFQLESFNPISQQKFERHSEIDELNERQSEMDENESENESEMDKCIFRGFLRDDPTVFATMTGGCPFEASFEVKLIFY